MYAAVKCFWVELTDPVRSRHSLRRYVSARNRPSGSAWTCDAGWHDASVVVGEIEPVPCEREGGHLGYWGDRLPNGPTPHDDPRWPKSCARCAYEFQEDDEWQDSLELLYRRTDTGEEMPLRDMAPGAMWDAWWLPDAWKGKDGRCLMAKCPNGSEWCIDSRATNCTMPEDTEHKCWVRHGEPPNLTVDKNGFTCAAGAGSIMAGDYHGFLQNGSFTAG